MRWLLFLLLPISLWAENCDQSRIVICGVCRNTAHVVDSNIQNIEALGSRFQDYAVVIYENNSTDNTAQKLSAWAEKNPKVCLLSETLSKKKLARARTVRVANARNKVLDEVRRKKYDKFRYLVMVDLDFVHPWPVDELVRSINHSFDWDCISANGIQNGLYYDRYAYRAADHPFGPELLENGFWRIVDSSPFRVDTQSWPLVYSAFGGLAIYKRDTIIKFSYSGVVTKALKRYYEQIMASLPIDHPHLVAYSALNSKKSGIIFRKNCLNWQDPKDRSKTVCEHVTLHAAMALKGYRTFYINPKLIMVY
ncbi:MAG: hypothetical protein JSR37_02265 [Verrucomicrobia bacterium]|nr:hypothetical protein [Verrucomicrobiota bacterium]MBS0636415.1 hypothetical protein [Verrucomicrobiota bacterium]